MSETTSEFEHYPPDRLRGRGRRATDRYDRKWNWSAIGVSVTIAAILLTALLNVSSRVTALENQSRNDSARMQRIEDLVYRIWERVR